MKKTCIIALIACLLLAGCSAKETTEMPQTTAPASVETPQETTAPTREETAPPETTAPAVEETPEEPAPAEEATQTQPESMPQKTEPQQTTQQTKPQQTATSTATPLQNASSGRKTSSATRKDTGSDKLWEDPNGGVSGDDYYEEHDPTRAAYLEYLKAEGNGFYYWLQEDAGMRMYLGRTYGMPLYTSYEMMVDSVWESSDPTVATVNEVGFVTPLKAGETVISVSYTDPDTQYVATRTTPVRVEGEPSYTYAYLEQRAHEEAKKIADYAMENGSTDLEKIGIAAALINAYVANGNGGSQYAIVDGELVTVQVPGYNQPFGTLVTFYSTCAGDTRALGLVLEYMGFEWYHAGEDRWDHQWCVVYDVDGQTAFADGSYLGIVGYGERKDDGSNWQKYQNGALTPV